MNEPKTSALQLAEVLRGTLRYLEDDLLSLDDCASIGSVSAEIFEPQDSLTVPQGIAFENTQSTAPLLARSLGAEEVNYAVAPKPEARSLLALMMSNDDMQSQLIDSFQQAYFEFKAPDLPKSSLLGSFIPSFKPGLFEPTPLADIVKPALPTTVHHSDWLLHKICLAYSASDEKSAAHLLVLVQKILEKDPKSILRRQVVCQKRLVWNPVTRQKVLRNVKSSYQYPLHIALANKHIPLAIIEIMLEAAMQLKKGGSDNALMLLNGPQLETPLMVLVKHRPQYVKLMDQFILSAPASVALMDRCSNTALHKAVMCGAGPVAVRHLVIVEPKSCLIKNRLGQTPLIIAQANSHTSCGVLNFLRIRTQCFLLKQR